MWLVKINIFSLYSENLDKKIILLRKDAIFLFKEYCLVVKYCNDDLCKSLNIECDESIDEIVISAWYLNDDSIILIPFNFCLYKDLNDEKRLFKSNKLVKFLIAFAIGELLF